MESAVYARQSVDKQNSLSIEGQLDLCRRAAGRPLRVYTDRGFSGRNTRRPAFQRLMGDIRGGRIDRLYVYRLDRFSRSVSDFGSLWDVLQAHHVEFVSVSESFDTATPMGRAMLHIIMVFAQLERETTAERVRDNYYKRAALGAWPGGPAPFGFTVGRAPDRTGRPISTLMIEPAQARVVERIFRLYAGEGASLGSLARTLNAEGVAGPRRETWDSVSLSRVLHCPAYVRADGQVLLHLRARGVCLRSEEAAFDGTHGLLLIDGPEGGQSASVLNSPGFIDPALWLACQSKLRKNRQLKNAGKGRHTWLSGLLKCAVCGYSLKVTVSGGRRYLHCSGRYNVYKCKARIHTDLGALEDAVAAHIQPLLDACPSPAAAPPADVCADRLRALEQKADRLTDAYAGSGDMTRECLDRALRRIEEERRVLLREAGRSARHAADAGRLRFSALSFDGKKAVAARLIERISVSEEDAEVFWRV